MGYEGCGLTFSGPALGYGQSAVNRVKGLLKNMKARQAV
jgi:hypothetical protein